MWVSWVRCVCVSVETGDKYNGTREVPHCMPKQTCMGGLVYDGR